MRYYKSTILAIAAAVLMQGCGGGATNSGVAALTVASGIEGIAVVGPISPVEKPGEPSTRPLGGATITVQPAGGGAEIARTTTTDDGRFRIPLGPGRYLVVALAASGGLPYPRPESQTVTVSAGAYTDIIVRYDSGIR
jgi:hypothetical protein